eukprot:jgi/Tetstr1/446073/TSEL_033674.t1
MRALARCHSRYEKLCGREQPPSLPPYPPPNNHKRPLCPAMEDNIEDEAGTSRRPRPLPQVRMINVSVKWDDATLGKAAVLAMTLDPMQMAHELLDRRQSDSE